MKEKIFCEMCKTQTDLKIDSFSRYHLKKYHDIGMKEYYDMFIRKENEGICPECGKKTKFESYYKGYRQFCSAKCAKSSNLTREKISKSFENRDVKKEADKRSKTLKDTYGVSHISKLDSIKKQKKNTCLESFGVESNLLTKECHRKRWDSLNKNKELINEKRREWWTQDNIDNVNNTRLKTCLQKYGVENVGQIELVKEKIRKRNEESGRWLTEDEYSEFTKYSYKVRNISRRKYEKLYETWNGHDYYTNEKLILNDEYLKDNPNNNVSCNLYQPTVDHKISIYYGFKNDISPEDISNINNLCICGRLINIYKNFKCEDEFKELLKNENRKQIYR